MKRPSGWLLLALGCAAQLGCASQYEEPTGTQPDNAREQVGAAELEAEHMDAPAAAEPIAPIEPFDRSLDDIALELASNEAKLRALGIELPSRATTGVDTNLGREGGERKPTPEPAQPGGAGTRTTDSQPSTAPKPAQMPKGDSGSSPSPNKQDRRDSKPSKKKKSEDKDESDRFAGPPPEEAKATPLSPVEQPQLDAATRCIQVCELSEISCELGVQICELAQRHAGDGDYEQACARATEDCDAAQEACDVCAG